ncbi:MAG: GDP-mannose 4,6-dehydratase [Planctomycetes bacterium]|nr:GDP-mannose 4,6-dehydratase [Planctomycetota bacterium]
MNPIWLTGADGFVGAHLRDSLDKNGIPWLALGLKNTFSKDGFSGHELDLSQVSAQGAGLSLDRLPEPAGLIHLAALSFAPACEQNPDLARKINVVGPCGLYSALFRRWPQCPVLHISSGQVYPAQLAPLTEEIPLCPINVYGATKAEGESVALGFHDRGHPISVVRPFNHTGPGQSVQFALPSFALRIAAIEKGVLPHLKVGALDSVKDYLDVQSVVETYRKLLPKAGDFSVVNVCSGVGYTMEELLEVLMQRADVRVEVVSDSTRMRGNLDAPCLVGDTTLLQSFIGEVPQFHPEAMAAQLLKDARYRLLSGESLEQA